MNIFLIARLSEKFLETRTQVSLGAMSSSMRKRAPPRHLVSDESIRRLASIAPGARKELYAKVRESMDQLLGSVIEVALFHMRHERQRRTIELEDVTYSLQRHGLDLSVSDACLERAESCTQLIRAKVKRVVKQALKAAVVREDQVNAQRYQFKPADRPRVPKMPLESIRALQLVYEAATVYTVRWAELMAAHARRKHMNHDDATIACAVVLAEFSPKTELRNVREVARASVPTMLTLQQRPAS